MIFRIKGGGKWRRGRKRSGEGVVFPLHLGPLVGLIFV